MISFEFFSRHRARLCAALVVCVASVAAASDWNQITNGTVVLFRHANAPGGGDPPGFQIDDCKTQRNLDDSGRMQAKRIGDAFRERGINVQSVLTSQWCRARDTAELAFPGKWREEPAFNSFFNVRDKATAQTKRAEGILSKWRGPGVMVVTTHQVNITALTNIVPASGEGVIVRFQNGKATVLGRVQP
jgi:phosphohistidine phosphatase SixA